jgi:hypothetical protein
MRPTSSPPSDTVCIPILLHDSRFSTIVAFGPHDRAEIVSRANVPWVKLTTKHVDLAPGIVEGLQARPPEMQRAIDEAQQLFDRDVMFAEQPDDDTDRATGKRTGSRARPFLEPSQGVRACWPNG